MKKTFSLLTLLLSGSFIFLITSFSGCKARHYQFIYRSHDISLLKYDDVLQDGDTCAFNAFAIKDSLHFELLTAGNTLHLGNEAYAWTFNDYYAPVEKITDIRVYPIYNYNTTYTAGSDLSAMCRFGVSGSDAATKAEAINALNETYMSDMNIRMLRIDLKEPPAAASSQQFILELRTEANAVVRGTSNVVYLTL